MSEDKLIAEQISAGTFLRLVEWLRSDPVKPAELAFTAGLPRQLAYALEHAGVVDEIRAARQVVASRGKDLQL